MREPREEHIWGPIARNPDLVGFGGALALNHVQLGNQSGYADLVLLPVAGPKKLVVIEAKNASDRRSSADVIGQLLKYYAHALDLGPVGIEALRVAARAARTSPQLSFKQVLGVRSSSDAEARCRASGTLRPEDLQLLIALDEDARRFEPRLFKTAAVLCERHQIPIGVVVVSPRGVEWRYRE